MEQSTTNVVVIIDSVKLNEDNNRKSKLTESLSVGGFKIKKRMIK